MVARFTEDQGGDELLLGGAVNSRDGKLLAAAAAAVEMPFPDLPTGLPGGRET